MVKLDDPTQALLDQMGASGAPPLYELSVLDARAILKEAASVMDAPKTEVHNRELFVEN